MNSLARVSTFRLVAALMSAELIGVFETTMLYAGMRSLIVEFGNPVRVGWIFTAYLLSMAVTSALGGRLGDMFGRRRVLIAALVLSVAGSVIAGLSTDLEFLILGRILQGSSGAIFPLCIGIIREHVPPRTAFFSIGFLAATITVSSGFGLILGGAIVDGFGWRWIFHVSAAAALCAVAIVMVMTPRSEVKHVPSSINVMGGLLFVPGIVGLLGAISLAPNWGWTDIRTAALAIVSLGVLSGWIVSELRAPVPLIDVRLMLDRRVAAANLTMLLSGLTALQATQITSLLLQQPSWTGVGLGLSATVAGIVLLPQYLTGLVGGVGTGWLMMRVGPRITVTLGSLLLSIGWVSLLAKHDNLFFIASMATVQGLGVSILYSSAPMLIVMAASPERTSEAVGMPAVFRQVGMAVGAQATALLLGSHTVSTAGSAGAFPTAAAYNLTLGYIASGCVACIVVSLFFLSKRQPGSEPPHPDPQALRGDTESGTSGDHEGAATPANPSQVLYVKG